MNTQEATTTKAGRARASSKKSQVATAKGKNTKKATTNHSAKSAPTGSNTPIVLELLRRTEGVTLAEIAKATDWQNHSIRGFIAGN